MAEKKLTKKEIVSAFWRWTFFSHANYNYERLEATGLVHAMKPVIKKLYGDNPEEYKACILRHMQFFNTEPHIGGIIPGIVLAMEEQRAQDIEEKGFSEIDADAINGVKTGLMGPFAGIGDTLWQGTLTPILLAFGISLGSQGSLLGPILYTVLMYGIMFPVAYICWMKGYELGKDGIAKLLGGNQMQMIITGASAMGAIVLGAMTSQFVSVNLAPVIKIGEMQLALQADVFDKIFLGILPLSLTLFTLFLLKNKKMKATTVMGILIAIGLVGGVVGLF